MTSTTQELALRDEYTEARWKAALIMLEHLRERDQAWVKWQMDGGNAPTLVTASRSALEILMDDSHSWNPVAANMWDTETMVLKLVGLWPRQIKNQVVMEGEPK